MGRLAIVAVVWPAAFACGDNLAPPPILPPDNDCPQLEDLYQICHNTSAPAATGDFGLSGEFDLTACPAGRTAGADLSGVYQSPVGDFSLTRCADGYQLRGFGIGRPGFSLSLHEDENGLLIRNGHERFTRALLVCGPPAADGSLAAVYGDCIGAGDCRDSAITIEPYLADRPNDELPASGLELVSELRTDSCEGPWPSHQFVSHIEYDATDQHAFITVGGSGLHIVDVGDADNPTTVSSVFDDTSRYNDIALFRVDGRRYAVLAGADQPIIDVTSPARPREVARIRTFAHRIDVKQTSTGVFLYSISGTLDVHDLSAPQTPRKIGSVDRGWDLHAPTITDDKLYVAAGSTGLVVMDDPRNDPENPTVHGIYVESAGQYSHHSSIFEVGGTTYALHNDEIGPERWFKVIDVSPESGTFLQEQSEYLTDPNQISHNITMNGTTGYLAYYNHGVRVVDVSDPTDIVERAYFHTFDVSNATFSFDGASDIAIDPERRLVFVADTPRGLVILRETF